MGSWQGDHKLHRQEDNSVQCGDSSRKNLKFTDLSLNLESHEDDDEELQGEDHETDANNREAAAVLEKEHMFEKIVTPSDVGKLNRLVIPKQHAERFFPLDAAASERGGLLLSFEDRTGKAWRFRYSYWNSSQSYVMTKGWSRFVKEKKLDAGDIVSFQRGIGDAGKDRLFIDWRHKPNPRSGVPMSISYPGTVSFPPSFSFHRPAPAGIWGISYPSNFPRDHYHHMGLTTASHNASLNPPRVYGNVMNSTLGDGSVICLRSSAAAPAGGGSGACGGGVDGRPVVFESVPVFPGAKAVMVAPTKRQLRLFGVNMDCPMSSESNEGDAPPHPSSSSLPMHYPHSNVYDRASVPNGWFDKGKGSASSPDHGV
ncbi:hypothetical protein SAY87_014560 [Trapa incisa]|uniref:TF-B3 domain-containing protein n=1 Tax=Trapa incisa TaxID=236973 RepID=A0AAN7H026_9MYRT|nr:hypothetical protein SAY87_014560 [Trapa incisa]